MNFKDAEIAIEIFKQHTCGQKREWEEYQRIPIDGAFEFGRNGVWISLPRANSNPDLTDQELKQLKEAKWFFDETQGAWSHM